MSNKSSNCPECNQSVSFTERPKIGLVFNCKSCDVELEVVDNAPLFLDTVFKFDDDDFDYDDDISDEYEYDYDG